MTVRIRKIAVDGIGPLRGFSLEPADLTVVEGDNEAGKSSIVVALHRHLSGTFRRANLASFEGVRRNVPGYDGEVSIELEPNPPAPAPGVGPAAFLEKLCSDPLLWNLLVIPEGRASDTSVGSGNDWLAESLQHLSGFDPDPLYGSIRNTAGLTPTGQDRKDWAERTAEIEKRIGDIESFLASLEELRGQEESLRTERSELAGLDRQAAEEREAVDFDRYDRARRALESLTEAEAELPGYQRFTPADLQTWRRLEGEQARAEVAAGEARRELDILLSEHADAGK